MGKNKGGGRGRGRGRGNSRSPKQSKEPKKPKSPKYEESKGAGRGGGAGRGRGANPSAVMRGITRESSKYGMGRKEGGFIPLKEMFAQIMNNPRYVKLQNK